MNKDEVLDKIKAEAKIQFEERLKKAETNDDSSEVIYNTPVISADEAAEISKRAAEIILNRSGWNIND
jgi:hypothetical protein